MTEQYSNTVYTPDDWHGIPGAFSVLAEATRRSNPEAFQNSAQRLDVNPIFVLKGLAYATCILSSIPEGEDHPMTKQSLLAIAEMVELMARLIEHQEDAAMDKICAKQAAQ